MDYIQNMELAVVSLHLYQEGPAGNLNDQSPRAISQAVSKIKYHDICDF
jgi:hypothetical protein